MIRPKMIFSRIVIVMACLFVGLSAASRQRQLTRQESDSLSHALATLWSDYLINKSKLDGDAVSKEYMRGLQEALKMADVNDAYFQGLEEGIAIASRLRQIEQTSYFKIDIPKFAYVLSRAEKGRPTGFSKQTAEAYIGRLIANFEKEEAVVEQSKAFLDQKAKEPGISRTPSGLLFEIITEGEGEMPIDGDVVLVKYIGTLIDGTEFNRSESAGVFFKSKELIPGFREGLTMMKAGGHYRLYIPAELGYGDQGVFGKVPGGAATIFDVELIDFRHVDENGDVIPRPGDNQAQ